MQIYQKYFKMLINTVHISDIKDINKIIVIWIIVINESNEKKSGPLIHVRRGLKLVKIQLLLVKFKRKTILKTLNISLTTVHDCFNILMCFPTEYQTLVDVMLNE